MRAGQSGGAFRGEREAAPHLRQGMAVVRSRHLPATKLCAVGRVHFLYRITSGLLPTALG